MMNTNQTFLAPRTNEEKWRGMPAHVLVVDNDSSMRQMVSNYLTDAELRVTALGSGREIMNVLIQDMVDILVLDLRMPGEDGMQITRELRQDSNVPIIMLASRNDEADRVMGLELGADDYLTKPFSPRELLARIRSVLRRTRSTETIAEGLAKLRGFRFAGWDLNVRLRRLKTPHGETLSLTNGEFNLLVAFLESPQRILSRDYLISRSRLHNDEVHDRAIDVQIGRLRKKMTIDNSRPALIRTERSAGYVFTEEVQIVR